MRSKQKSNGTVTKVFAPNKEDWRSIPGFPSYLISNDGRVLSLRRKQPRFLKPFRGGKGAYQVCLFDNQGRVKTCWVAPLVAEAFLGPRPHNGQVRHRNGNRADNRSENLVYMSCASGNHHDWYLGRRRARIGLEDVRSIRSLANAGLGDATIGKRFGLRPEHVKRIRIGYHWGWVPIDSQGLR